MLTKSLVGRFARHETGQIVPFSCKATPINYDQYFPILHGVWPADFWSGLWNCSDVLSHRRMQPRKAQYHPLKRAAVIDKKQQTRGHPRQSAICRPGVVTGISFGRRTCKTAKANTRKSKKGFTRKGCLCINTSTPQSPRTTRRWSIHSGLKSWTMENQEIA